MTIDSDAKPSFNKEVLIVGMSATALKSEQDEGFKNGMHFFCPKPVGLHLLSTILDNCRTHTSLNDRINGICDDTDAHKIPQVEQQANDKSPESFRSIKQFLQSNGSE